MPDSNNAKKREYRKGNPQTQSDYNNRYKQKKIANDDKELRVFIPKELKDELVIFCRKEGYTQSGYLTLLLEQARQNWK
ncbi:RepB family protein [Xenorhabdus sp. KJ12.1]|uniref:RepB family protein n=1 Tax=Xenorhabdus TaxID=626 RepID=UPI000C040485|nr:RepB family protein [Xenorhabdus sp. KJ12.1]PHM67978.1 hypothetical protein Xekj_03701 [Xenorhabdus sp. KJ12.1]